MRTLWTIALLLSLGSSLEAQGDYETPPKLRASDVLPTDMQAGEHFTVRPVVENDGVTNHYTVDSDYGPFEAYGDLSLAILIRQIHAIGELQQVSKSKEFVKAVERSATSQLKSIQQFGEHPVDTIKGMPNGIKHMFQRYKKQAKQGYKTAKQVGGEAVDAVTPGTADEGRGESDGDGDAGKSSPQQLAGSANAAAEAYAKKWFGLSRAEQSWYKKLGVDPYNRNPVLREKVHQMAKVDSAANVGMKFVPIPSIPGAHQIQQMNEAVWDTHPEELRAENIKSLQEAGIDEKLIGSFMDNAHLSPSEQTLMLSTLAQMKGVEGREVILQISAQADSVELAGFDLANALFLEAYHRSEAPILKVFPEEPVPVAKTSENGLIIIVSADYAFWEADLAEVITLMAGKFADQGAATRELWLRGKASPRFVAETGQLGWTVREMIDVTAEVKEEFTQLPQQ